MTQNERTHRLIGTKGVANLRSATITVAGLGGVGSFCIEALARSGVGHLRIIDHDTVSASNCNRQLHALQSTLGQPKVDVMKSRVLDIDPTITVEAVQRFFASDTADELLAAPTDLIIDAIDALGPKIELLARCKESGIPVITALGGAARLDPTKVRIAPLAETSGDPLASRVRKLLRRRTSLDGITAVFSVEPPVRTAIEGCPTMTDDLFRGRQRVIQPSMMMVPAAIGLAAAAEAVRRISAIGSDT
ncbi:MAG: tRNA threonylcarbamoyladenosine dehydratase [Polyangiaceae bacterium]|nr:tRNA threonylcarbamoyladenosine dehydratase [Polyangiaceae bacterium]